MLARLRSRLAAALLAAAAALPAGAADFSWSGFGTVGYARSDRDYAYQRFIDDEGSFKRDSLLGAQLDVSFSPQWSATVQARLAPGLEDDGHWDVKPTWAFLGWRPNDDWLLRAGRLRIPLYLYSQTMDVGQTHDMARLPTEMYSITPTSDFDGLALARIWPTASGELTLEGYHGSAHTTARFWTRDGLPPVVEPGARFLPITVKASGLVLTLREPDTLARLGAHATRTNQRNGGRIPRSFPRVELAPGLGYYQVNPALPGPGFDSLPAIHNLILTAGVEQSLGGGWRIAAEFARNLQRDTEFGSGTRGGYLALFKQIDRFTPYASFSWLKADSSRLDWYRRLTGAPLPGVIPGAGQINQAQRLAAEAIWTADQHSLALGSSYAVTPSSKLKFEWLRTHVGEVSRLIDTPPGSESPRETGLNVFTLNYSFAF
ncbi:hypothetical protein [Derxia lacustris]|uniref:hypothetical protein n=1 Tax=Derxia lacustris TaxID=764842 RepID=UPI000A16DB5B|nr:hypothetical protein [Derxia lacustris]